METVRGYVFDGLSEERMTTTTPYSDGEYAEIVSKVLDWMDRQDASPDLLSDAFQLLSVRRRRVTLRVVREYDDDLTLPDLAEEVAIRESHKPIPEIPPETVTEVYISLYHDHMPRLVDTGLLEYEQERDLVSPGTLSVALEGEEGLEERERERDPDPDGDETGD